MATTSNKSIPQTSILKKDRSIKDQTNYAEIDAGLSGSIVQADQSSSRKSPINSYDTDDKSITISGQQTSSSEEVYYSAESDFENDVSELTSGKESLSSPITVRSLDRQTAKNSKQTRTISFAQAADSEELCKETLNAAVADHRSLNKLDAAQRPISLKISSKARASSQISQKRKQKRSFSIDMLGGTGAYESGDVDDLVANYRPLLATFQLIKKPLGLPHWFPTFEKSGEGINLSSVVRSKEQREKVNCCVDDDADTLVQDVRVNVKVQVRVFFLRWNLLTSSNSNA